MNQLNTMSGKAMTKTARPYRVAYKGGFITRPYHPEYGNYVYQPEYPGVTLWMEPYVTEKEAQAFIEGLELGRKNDQERADI